MLLRKAGFACGLLAAVVTVVWLWRSIPEGPSPDSVIPSALAVQSRDCDFVSSFGFHVDCYWVPVGEGRARARLAAAIFRAADNDSPDDPLVYIAGGPGEADNAGEEGLANWDLWLAEVGIGRDFVLLDLRGLSPSDPAWDCERYTTSSRELLNRDLTFAEEGKIIAPILQDCLSEWQKNLGHRGGPVEQLRDFSSQRNAEDLGESLRRLGYQQWNYLAVSYGTRVALLAAMQQPEVRRVILDSPYPLDRGAISDSVVLWVEAFDRYWQRCKAELCEFSEPQFWQLMSDLRRAPVWVEMENWHSGRKEQWLLNDGRLAAALYTAFYSSELTVRIASALHQYTEGKPEELNAILEVFFNQAFDSRFNSAIYWATECNDNPLEDEVFFENTLTSAGEWRPFFSADWQHSVCRSQAFAPGQLPPMTPLTAPFLVAVGELDPITTATHARDLMSWLPNGHLLIQEQRSHAEFFMGTCGQDLIPWFLNATREQLAAEWAGRSADCAMRGLAPVND